MQEINHIYSYKVKNDGRFIAKTIIQQERLAIFEHYELHFLFNQTKKTQKQEFLKDQGDECLFDNIIRS